tara:strand:- start:22750 stop:23931 length:1182 start_codon:yes stop_codon:yes gene_type:complete
MKKTGTIIRARPKYLGGINILGNEALSDEKEYFFNSGSAALKLFLIWLSKEQNKEIVIGMQAFNCKVVLDAAIEANCKVILSDISLKYFSMTLSSVKKLVNQENIDVLLLTHYQGIPNEEYQEIVGFCNEKNVLVIEDISQTYGSSLNGIEVGSQGYAALYSYAFDKPFTCMFGGSMKFNVNVKQSFKSLFSELFEESYKESKHHLQILNFLWKYTNSDFYKDGVENYKAISLLKIIGFNNSFIYFILSKNLLSLLISKTLSLINNFLFYKKIKIKKLHPMKIGLIKKQIENFFYDKKGAEYFIKFCKDNSLEYPKYENQSSIYWNRFSFIDDKSLVKKKLIKKGYQVSNYNWPITLDKLTKSHKVIILEDLDNSLYASKKILNVPIWNMYGK